MRTRIAGVLAVLGPGAIASAQTRAAAAEVQVAETNLSVAPPFAAGTGSETRVFLSGDNANSVATFSAGVRTITTEGRTTAAVLGGTVPLQKGADDANFATRDRLSNGAVIALTIHSVFWKPPSAGLPAAVINWCNAEKKRDSTRLAEVSDCEELQPSRIKNRLDRERLKAIAGYGQPWTFDLKSEVGRANRQFLNSASLQPDSLDATAWSIGADIGRFVSTELLRLGFVDLGASYGVKYKPGKEGQGCVPVGTAGALQCRTAPIGSPKRKEGGTIHGELRAFLSDRFALNPNYSFASAGSVSSYAMAIYFVPNAKGGLIGGIEPAWDTDERRFGLRAFIGTAAFGVGEAK